MLGVLGFEENEGEESVFIDAELKRVNKISRC